MRNSRSGDSRCHLPLHKSWSRDDQLSRGFVRPDFQTIAQFWGPFKLSVDAKNIASNFFTEVMIPSGSGVWVKSFAGFCRHMTLPCLETKISSGMSKQRTISSELLLTWFTQKGSYLVRRSRKRWNQLVLQRVSHTKQQCGTRDFELVKH
jgi:hypothetical protein